MVENRGFDAKSSKTSVLSLPAKARSCKYFLRPLAPERIRQERKISIITGSQHPICQEKEAINSASATSWSSTNALAPIIMIVRFCLIISSFKIS